MYSWRKREDGLHTFGLKIELSLDQKRWGEERSAKLLMGNISIYSPATANCLA